MENGVLTLEGEIVPTKDESSTIAELQVCYTVDDFGEETPVCGNVRFLEC